METTKVVKVTTKFECKYCNYKTSRKTDYDRHLVTLKHKKATEETTVETENITIVKEYVGLPDLPVNCEITIDKIGAYNYNILTNDSNKYIKYAMFTSVDPNKYPVGKNKVMDYMPDDYVSPVVITTIDGIKYKVDDLFWFPLCDVYERILTKQHRTGKRFFPLTIFIDELSKNKTNKWISTLKNLTHCYDSNAFPDMEGECAQV